MKKYVNNYREMTKNVKIIKIMAPQTETIWNDWTG